MKARVVIGALVASNIAYAGPIADTFRDGIFGLPWGSDADVIAAKFPEGKWQKVAGGIRYYTVRDGRPILDIERKSKNEITFSLSSDGRLSSASITFPPDAKIYAALALRAKEQFGPTETVQDSSNQENKIAPSTSFSNIWPIDEGIDVRLVNFTSMVGTFVSLTVTNTTIGTTKSAGFQ